MGFHGISWDGAWMRCAPQIAPETRAPACACGVETGLGGRGQPSARLSTVHQGPVAQYVARWSKWRGLAFQSHSGADGVRHGPIRAGATAAREEAVASQAVPKPQPARPAASAPPRNQILADLHERRAKRRQVRGVGRCGGV